MSDDKVMLLRLDLLIALCGAMGVGAVVIVVNLMDHLACRL